MPLNTRPSSTPPVPQKSYIPSYLIANVDRPRCTYSHNNRPIVRRVLQAPAHLAIHTGSTHFKLAKERMSETFSIEEKKGVRAFDEHASTRRTVALNPRPPLDLTNVTPNRNVGTQNAIQRLYRSYVTQCTTFWIASFRNRVGTPGDAIP